MNKTNRTHPAYGAANRAKTHCPMGHPYDSENTYSKRNSYGRMERHCRKCKKERDHLRYLRRKNEKSVDLFSVSS